jgi:hypothetical protein
MFGQPQSPASPAFCGAGALLMIITACSGMDSQLHQGDRPADAPADECGHGLVAVVGVNLPRARA